MPRMTGASSGCRGWSRPTPEPPGTSPSHTQPLDFCLQHGAETHSRGLKPLHAVLCYGGGLETGLSDLIIGIPDQGAAMALQDLS